MRALVLALCLTSAVFAERRFFAGGSADLVIPYQWHTDSVYTYDSTVDWYRAVHYNLGIAPGASVFAGFEDRLAGAHRFGLELGYAFVPPASETIDTQQQVGATLVKIRERATLTHHTPRLSIRYTCEMNSQWNLIARIGIADRIVRRTIEPEPQNLLTGVVLTPGNYPARDDVYGVLTADLAGGIEYVADGRHGISFLVAVNPPVVYPETVRNHIVLPYFATLSLGYRYLW